MKQAYMVYDLGGTSIKTAVMTEDGKLLENGSIKTGTSFDTCMDHMIEELEEKQKLYDIKGVAISAPGAVDSETGIIGGGSALKFIHGPNWKDVWKEKTGFDIAIENDANCAALSELHFGEAQDIENFIYIVIGTGIGGAIVTDRKLRKGVNLHGGEFGYNVLPHDEGPEYQTWSTLGSTVATEKRYNRAHPEDKKTGKEIFDMADTGDKDAMVDVEKFYNYNALGIYNLQFVTDPEIILIGGGISRRADFEERLKAALVEVFKYSDAAPRPVIKVGRFLDDANLYGALANLLFV